jgi:hypothetical protein
MAFRKLYEGLELHQVDIDIRKIPDIEIRKTRKVPMLKRIYLVNGVIHQVTMPFYHL